MKWLVFLAFGLFIEYSLADVAIITHDRAPLRNAARPSAQVLATLLQGEAVEVRGERLDYLQVWDYQRERGGFVRASQVLRLETLAPHEILAALRLAQALPASEVLGIALASAFLQEPAEGDMEAAIEALDAIGSLAERLARRGAPGTLEAAGRYGVRFASVERDARVVTCYDGEAFRRVLALPSTPAQRARAALALTRAECSPDALSPAERIATQTWRADVLDKVDVKPLAPHVRNRVLLRRAAAWSALAFYRARGWGEKGELAATAAQRAIAELGSVERQALLEEDRRDWTDAVARVQASRWAATTPSAPAQKGPRLVTEHGRPGETCLTLVDAKPLARRCTYGVVWTSSASLDKHGKALSVAVQHTETHRESWAFRRGAKGWTVSVRRR
jgi:hypothetical protein